MDRLLSFSSCYVPSPFRFCYPEMRSLAGSHVCPHSSQPLLLLLSLSALCSALARPQCCRYYSTADPPWSLSVPNPSALSEQDLGNGAKCRAMPALLLPITQQLCRAVAGCAGMWERVTCRVLHTCVCARCMCVCKHKGFFVYARNIHVRCEYMSEGHVHRGACLRSQYRGDMRAGGVEGHVHVRGCVCVHGPCVGTCVGAMCVIRYSSFKGSFLCVHVLCMHVCWGGTYLCACVACGWVRGHMHSVKSFFVLGRHGCRPV